ncbi:MAG: 2-C-methyl-D-erythritol 2,4-cyclodiphosphate synthase [Pseudohongiellaceae bacterium]|jgi:2-C-methyl-D-erythritol 2,4-cyclodiphosphate synthase
MSLSNLRIGHGFDVHKFADQFDADKPLILAGVTLAERKSLLAHSDGDVVLHSLIDGLLGAMACGDIGQLFPDTDPNIKGISSVYMLNHVLDLLAQKNGQLINIDVTAVAQVPKLSPYREAITQSLGELTGLPLDRVNFKATTTERMGYVGREEGIACHCVVLLEITPPCL